jgi:hypothetical protein
MTNNNTTTVPGYDTLRVGETRSFIYKGEKKTVRIAECHADHIIAIDCFNQYKMAVEDIAACPPYDVFSDPQQHKIASYFARM